MIRACKLTLKFTTAEKRRKISALLRRYRSAVNFFIRVLWHEGGGLDKATLDRLEKTLLSATYRCQALKQAVDIVTRTRRAARATGQRTSCPHFRGACILNSSLIGVNVEQPGGNFDVFIRMSTLVKNRRIVVPTKATAVLRKWLSVPGAAIIQGCAITEDCVTVWVTIPDPSPRCEGDVLGVDLGICKLVATSDGEFFGRDFRAVRDKILRKKPGSARRQCAFRERDNYIGYVLNQLPWHRMSVIGREDLTGVKRGKKPGRGKAFRKAMAPWAHRQIADRIDQKAQANGVRLVTVDPRGTSRTCPMCGKESIDNRQGEAFRCVQCNYSADADFVGATNILTRTCDTLGSVQSPKRQMPGPLC